MKIPPSDCRLPVTARTSRIFYHKLCFSLFTLIALAALCSLVAAQVTQPILVASSKPALTVSPALAQQLANAEGSFDSQFPASWSLGIFMEAADHGSAAGMRDVGLVSLDTDSELALSWFERAAVAGDVRANSYVGDFYLDPKNGTPDLNTARYWYEKSYALKDARGTFELSQMYCNGQGVAPNQPECERLVADSTQYFKPSDPAETRHRIEDICNALGDRYSKGTLVKVNYVASAGWYDKAAVLGLTPAAVAEARLYTVKPGLPQNLIRAEAILDGIVANHNAEPGKEMPGVNPANPHYKPGIMDFNGEADVAKGYIEIGKQYEARGPNSMLKALPLYVKATNLHDDSGALKLGLRYLNGTGVPVNLDQAYKILMGITYSPLLWDFALADALDMLADAYSTASHQVAHAARIKELRDVAKALRTFTPLALAVVAPPMAPLVAVSRYPNLSAPDTVTTQQDFGVNVSLNSIAFDANTQILSGNQQNGQLQIALPLGMSSMPIQVDLIAPGMTFTDGSNSGTIILDANNPNSTPAVFHLKAGAVPADGVLLATLSYHQNFIAQLERKISVVAAAATPENSPPVVSTLPPATPPIVDTTAGATMRAENATSLNAGAPKLGVSVPVPASHPMMQHAAAPTPPGTAKPLPPVSLDPTEKTTDLTITETLVDDTIYYSFNSPGLVGTVYSTVPMALATKLKVQQAYDQLQGQSNILAQGSGATCAAQRQKGLGTDSDPLCKDSVNARAVVEGIGNDLYDNLAPQEFRTIYQLLNSNHIRLHTITVVTNSPTLPWELMRPLGASGTRDFLGLTAAITRENMASPQLAQPAEVQFIGLDVVAPTYSGDLTLNGTTSELKAIQANFPQANSVPGKATSVSAMVRNAPQGIIHFTGHSLRISQSDLTAQSAPTPAPATTPAAPQATATSVAPAAATATAPTNATTLAAAEKAHLESLLAPQVAIALEDESMTPQTFTAIREDGMKNAPTHPFYFFNACDLGRSDPQLDYIDGWAPALMHSGASGYLGALYEVSDTGAVSFATHFYTGLKANLASNGSWTMAELVTQARKATYSEANDPTALAYVLYSKPSLKLVAENGSGN